MYAAGKDPTKKKPKTTTNIMMKQCFLMVAGLIYLIVYSPSLFFGKNILLHIGFDFFWQCNFIWVQGFWVHGSGLSHFDILQGF